MRSTPSAFTSGRARRDTTPIAEEKPTQSPPIRQTGMRSTPPTLNGGGQLVFVGAVGMPSGAAPLAARSPAPFADSGPKWDILYLFIFTILFNILLILIKLF